MRSNKKYKGKYTKKRLENLVRGQDPRYKGSPPYSRYIRRQVEASMWYFDGLIDYRTLKQWGYN